MPPDPEQTASEEPPIQQAPTTPPAPALPSPMPAAARRPAVSRTLSDSYASASSQIHRARSASPRQAHALGMSSMISNVAPPTDDSPDRHRAQHQHRSGVRRSAAGAVDADTHWLSEDEGVNQTERYLAQYRDRVASGALGSSRAPVSSNRPPTPPDEDDDDSGTLPWRRRKPSSPGAKRADTIVPLNRPAARHLIDHRPASAMRLAQSSASPTSSDGSGSPTLDVFKLLRVLRKALVCVICKDTLLDATNLECGHPACLRCVQDLLASTPPPLDVIPPASGNTPPVVLQMPPTVAVDNTGTTVPAAASTSRAAVPAVAGPGLSLPNWSGLRAQTNAAQPAPPPAARSVVAEAAAGPPNDINTMVAQRMSTFRANLLRGRGQFAQPTPAAPTAPPRPLCTHPLCRSRSWYWKQAESATTKRRPDVLVAKLCGWLTKLEIHTRAMPTPDSHRNTSDHRTPSAHHRPSPESLHTSSNESISSPADELDDHETKRGRKGREFTTHKRTRQASEEEAAEQEPSGLPEPVQVGSNPLSAHHALVEPFATAELLSEFECQVCVNLLSYPVTTPCGHTFCRKCLARSADHSDKCPLCRTQLPPPAILFEKPANTAVISILRLAFGPIYKDRIESQEKEEAALELDKPIFVCALAWPNTPTFLHVFEPRYRLLMRRALDKDRRFGMVLPSQAPGGVHPYGTMLEIKSMELLPDGRSMVETVGVHRFKLLQTGTLDGYTVGQVEPIYDISAEQEQALEEAAVAESVRLRAERAARIAAGEEAGPEVEEELTTDQLLRKCHEFLDVLRSGAAPWLRQKLNDTLGPMPDSPSDFSFYMAAVIPIHEYEKAKLLPITSTRLRLRLLVFWIEQLRSSWWFNRGCTIM